MMLCCINSVSSLFTLKIPKSTLKYPDDALNQPKKQIVEGPFMHSTVGGAIRLMLNDKITL